MTNLLSQADSPGHKAVQYLLAIVTILIMGKLITVIPVMDRLQLLDTYRAAEIVWFSAKLAVLILFFYFSRSTIAAIPDTGSFLSFIRNILEPLTVLIIAIIGQEMLWQLLDPFVKKLGGKIYFSLAILLIVAISIWLVFRAYQSAPYLFGSRQKITKLLSRVVPILHKNCEACGEQIKGSAIFCSHCGHKVKPQENCLECGQALLANEKFCRQCGTAINSNIAINED